MNDNAAPALAPARFDLSFTSGALLLREGVQLSSAYQELHDWEQVRAHSIRVNLLQSRTNSTGVRQVRETIKRLSALTDDEVEMLVEATAAERGCLMWAAACRRYELIGLFAEEVVRERFLTLASTVVHKDFDGFVRTKALWHEELGTIKESTLRKLRSNLFKMLKEVGFLSDAGCIIPVLLSERVGTLLRKQDPSDIRFFPTHMSIQRVMQ